MIKKGVRKEIESFLNSGVKRILVSYKDSAIGRGVISYENGLFTRLLSVGNNPRVTVTKKISYELGLTILTLIAEGRYSVQSLYIIRENGLDRNVLTVRKDGVLV